MLWSFKSIPKKIADQLSVLEHVAFGGFTHPQAVSLAERISILRLILCKSSFSDNGSTANEVV